MPNICRSGIIVGRLSKNHCSVVYIYSIDIMQIIIELRVSRAITSHGYAVWTINRYIIPDFIIYGIMCGIVILKRDKYIL